MESRLRYRTVITLLTAIGTVLALTSYVATASAEKKVARATKSALSNTQRPHISGTPAIGNRLRGVVGDWHGVVGRRRGSPSYSLRWTRCSVSNKHCKRIKGATGTKYVLRIADVGSVIRLAVKASNARRSLTRISAPTKVIRLPAPTKTSARKKVIPLPAPSTPRPDIGVVFHCAWSDYNDSQRTQVLDKMKAAGVTWVRIDVGWSSLQEVGRGLLSQWYVDTVDRCVNLARARGINVLAMLWATPSWANGGQSRNVPPLDVKDFAWIANWAANHFRGRVAAWEVWNEPDSAQSSWSWGGDVAQYVGLLKAAYPAFKSGDPSAQVVFAGTSSADESFVKAAYQAGAKGSFDVMAVHPYQAISDLPPEQVGDSRNWWFARVDALHQVMVNNGDDDKPVWFTEFGWSSHATASDAPNWQRGVTEAQQGDYLVRAIRYARAHYPWVKKMFLYAERNRTGVDIQNANYGLLRYDLSEKPAYQALRTYLTS